MTDLLFKVISLLSGLIVKIAIHIELNLSCSISLSVQIYIHIPSYMHILQTQPCILVSVFF